jgi:O-antigen ligase
MTGFTEHPNDLGSATAVALVPALLVATLSGGDGTSLRRIGRWVPVVLIAVGLALSGSVSAMLAAALAVIVWISSPSVRAPARVAVAAALVCTLAVMAVGAGRVSSPVQRVTQIANAGAANGGSVQDRLSIVQQTWPRITDDPFIGAGLDTSDSAVGIISHGYTTSYQVHGLPLAAWYETGILGVAGIIGLLGALATTGWRAVADSETGDDVLVALALLAAFIAWVVVAMTQPMVFQQYGWISAVFIVAWRLCTQPTVGGAPVTNQPGARRARQEPAHSVLTAQ